MLHSTCGASLVLGKRNEGNTGKSVGFCWRTCHALISHELRTMPMKLKVQHVMHILKCQVHDDHRQQFWCRYIGETSDKKLAVVELSCCK